MNLTSPPPGPTPHTITQQQTPHQPTQHRLTSPAQTLNLVPAVNEPGHGDECMSRQDGAGKLLREEVCERAR